MATYYVSTHLRNLPNIYKRTPGESYEWHALTISRFEGPHWCQKTNVHWSVTESAGYSSFTSLEKLLEADVLNEHYVKALLRLEV